MLDSKEAADANVTWRSTGDMTFSKAYSLKKSNESKKDTVFSDSSHHGRSIFRNQCDNSSCSIWQWQSRCGQWKDFPKDANDTIMEFCSKGKGTTVIVNLNGQL